MGMGDGVERERKPQAELRQSESGAVLGSVAELTGWGMGEGC